jgi:hypothetical protein
MLLFLQGTQQLRLQADWYFTDLIQKQGPVIGELHQAGLGFERAREGPLVVSKEFRFEQVLWQRSAVDCDEGICRARTAGMNRPSGEFLSRARLSVQQNTGFGAGGSISARKRLFERRAFTDHPRQRLFGGRGFSDEAERAQ